MSPPKQVNVANGAVGEEKSLTKDATGCALEGAFVEFGEAVVEGESTGGYVAAALGAGAFEQDINFLAASANGLSVETSCDFTVFLIDHTSSVVAVDVAVAADAAAATSKRLGRFEEAHGRLHVEAGVWRRGWECRVKLSRECRS